MDKVKIDFRAYDPPKKNYGVDEDTDYCAWKAQNMSRVELLYSMRRHMLIRLKNPQDLSIVLDTLDGLVFLIEFPTKYKPPKENFIMHDDRFRLLKWTFWITLMFLLMPVMNLYFFLIPIECLILTLISARGRTFLD